MSDKEKSFRGVHVDLKNRLNKNLNKITVSAIRLFDQEVSTIPGIQKLTLGEPNFFTPDHVKQAAIKSIQDNQNHYTHNAGLIELRQAIADFYQEKYALKFRAEDEILTTVGVTEAISTVIYSIIEANDQILIPAPAYPGYGAPILLNGGEIVEIDTRSEGFLLTPYLLDNTLKNSPRAKALILNYPSNPTGASYSREQLAQLAKVISQYNIFVIADEVYSELSYSLEGHHSIAEFIPEQTIILNGLSKSHAMTGWRIGYILAQRELISEFTKTHQYLVTAASTTSQYAALEALRNGKDDPSVMKKAYIERRDFLVKSLKTLNFQVINPAGAFYIFAKIPEFVSLNSHDFLLDFAKKKSFAFIPGSAFGKFGEGYVRISYASSMEVIKSAMSALDDYLKEYLN